jgi:hypothetical protein
LLPHYHSFLHIYHLVLAYFTNRTSSLPPAIPATSILHYNRGNTPKLTQVPKTLQPRHLSPYSPYPLFHPFWVQPLQIAQVSIPIQTTITPPLNCHCLQILSPRGPLYNMQRTGLTFNLWICYCYFTFPVQWQK